MNRIRGRKAKSNGARFELVIEHACSVYAHKGIAMIEKTPEPLKMIRAGRGSEVVAVFEKKAQPDFQGTLQGGRSIVFEAKHTNDTNIKFDRITATQHKYLTKHELLGASVYIIISFNFKRFFLVPYYHWVCLEEALNKKSVNVQDLKEYEIDLERGFLNFLKWRDKYDEPQ